MNDGLDVMTVGILHQLGGTPQSSGRHVQVVFEISDNCWFFILNGIKTMSQWCGNT